MSEPNKHAQEATKSLLRLVSDAGETERLEFEGAIQLACEATATEAVKELQLSKEIQQRDNVLAMEELARQADSAEQLVLQMRGAIAGFKWLGNNLHNIKEDADRFKEFYEATLLDAEKALSLSAPIAGKWVLVEDVRPLLEAYKADWEREQFRMDFLAKHGDKLDNI